MMIDLDNPSPQTRYIPDVNGFNFVQLSHGLGTVRSNPLVNPYEVGGPGYYRYDLSEKRGWGMEGLGIDYCKSHPPNAATVAQIQAAGGSVNLIDCSYSTGGTNETGGAPSSQPPIADVGTEPVQQIVPEPQYEDCTKYGLASSAAAACTERNLQAQTSWQTAQLVADNTFNNSICKWNAQPASYCDTIYPPGAASDEAIRTPVPLPTATAAVTPPATPPVTQNQASAQTGQPNQNVPPNPQPGNVPAPSGVPSTSNALANQNPPAGGSGTQIPSCFSIFPASWGFNDSCSIPHIPVGVFTLGLGALGAFLLWKGRK